MSNPTKIILLAEDNPADVYLLRQALDLHGGSDVGMTVVTDGEEALDYILRRKRHLQSPTPDLIVLDLNLPKSDGSDVLRTIRENSGMAEAPVIVLTSSDSPKDRMSIKRLGADMYLTKPSELDAFLGLGETLMGFVSGRIKRANFEAAC